MKSEPCGWARVYGGVALTSVATLLVYFTTALPFCGAVEIGHPTCALTVVTFSMLVSSGGGAASSVPGPLGASVSAIYTGLFRTMLLGRRPTE